MHLRYLMLIFFCLFKPVTAQEVPQILETDLETALTYLQRANDVDLSSSEIKLKILDPVGEPEQVVAPIEDPAQILPQLMEAECYVRVKRTQVPWALGLLLFIPLLLLIKTEYKKLRLMAIWLVIPMLTAFSLVYFHKVGMRGYTISLTQMKTVAEHDLIDRLEIDKYAIYASLRDPIPMNGELVHVVKCHHFPYEGMEAWLKRAQSVKVRGLKLDLD